VWDRAGRRCCRETVAVGPTVEPAVTPVSPSPGEPSIKTASKAVESADEDHQGDVAKDAEYPSSIKGGPEKVGDCPKEQNPGDSNDCSIKTELFGDSPESSTKQRALGSQPIK
jgi:hypothetical protein